MTNKPPPRDEERTIKGLLLEMKLSEHHELKVLAEETILSRFDTLQAELDEAKEQIETYKYILADNDKHRAKIMAQLTSVKSRLTRAESLLRSLRHGIVGFKGNGELLTEIDQYFAEVEK